MRILLVEDEKKIREGLAAMIEQADAGIAVAGQAENGKEALQWLKANVADAVMTDIRMGEMNGIEMLIRLRTLYPDLPVVIVSGYSDFEYTKEAIRHGVVDYLLKPVNKVELSGVMIRLHEQWKAQHGLAAEQEEDQETLQERKAIRQVKAIIHASLDKELSLSYLAEMLYMHPKYLSVLFKKETGQNLSEYVTKSRIEKAKQLLQETNLKIMEIADLCGFHNTRYFMTVFKQQTGQTPTAFRNR